MAINAISGLTLNFRDAVEGAEKASAKDMLRMSTGLRINSAADDAAGLAISSRMNAQSRGMAMAIRNANDLLSMTQTAEGAAKDINDALQRMRELSVQAANETLNAGDRKSINLEIGLLKEHINAISKQTKFNNINLLDGSLKNTSFQIGGNTGDTLKLSMPALDTANLAQTPVTNKYKLTFTALAAGQSVTVAGLTFKATADTTAAEVTAAFSNLAENATTGVGTTTGEYSGSLTGFSSGKAVSTTLELTTTASNMKGDVPKVAVTQIDAIVTNSYKLTFSELLTGQAVTVAGLTYTATSDSSTANVATAFSNLTEGATSGSGSTGTYSGIFTGFETTNANNGILDITSDAQNPTGASPSVSVTQLVNPRTTSTYNIQFSNLITGQSVTVAGLTYTATSDEAASSVASAFANLNEGATSGNGAGSYSGALAGFNTHGQSGALVSSATTASNVRGLAPQTAAFGGAAPPLPTRQVLQVGTTTVQAVTGQTAGVVVNIPNLQAGQSVTIDGLTFHATQAVTGWDLLNIFSISPGDTDTTIFNQILQTPSYAYQRQLGYFTGQAGEWGYLGGGVVSAVATDIGLTPLGIQNGVLRNVNVQVGSIFYYQDKTHPNTAVPNIQISSNPPSLVGNIYEVPGITEVQGVTGSGHLEQIAFNDLKKGQSVSLCGLTYTAKQDLTASQVSQAFWPIRHGTGGLTLAEANWQGQGQAYLDAINALGTYSGTFQNADAYQKNTDGSIVFTALVNGPVANWPLTTSGVPAGTSPTSTRISSVTQPNAIRPTIANGSSSTTTTATEPRVEIEASTAHELPHNLNAITVETAQGASDAIQVIDTSIEAVSKFQAELGALENRVESVISNLTTANTDLKESLSRIEDADYAVETSNMAKHQIISQAAMAMLAQANQSTNTVASLLKSVG
jgi:flagellin